MTSAIEIDTMLTNISQQLQAKLAQQQITHPKMIGIHTGGVWVADYLHQQLNLNSKLGYLDISFYRDDFTKIGINPSVKPSQLPFTVEDQHIILVDDVLYTGRTIRAALNEIFDYGRPASVLLVVLAERNGRELPIQADIIGHSWQLSKHQQIKITGPKPLKLEILTNN